MATLDAAALDDLRDALAEVEDKKPKRRLMAVINYLEEDDATMAEVAERYGYTSPWLSRWVDRLDRLADEPVETLDDLRDAALSALNQTRFVNSERMPSLTHSTPRTRRRQLRST